MKKRLISMLLIATMTMTVLVGCGKKEETTKDKTNEAPTTTEATVSPEETVSETSGSVDGLTYQNSDIGFTLTAPDNWVMKGAEETYEYLVSNGAAKDVTSLKSALESQGINYLCYATDSVKSANGGNDNIIVQSMPESMFGEIEIEDIITSLTALFEQQFTSLGATTTMSEPVKSVVNEQDVYQISATATMNLEGVTSVVRQEYIIFMRKGNFINMIISTAKEDSAALAEQFVDGIVFE